MVDSTNLPNVDINQIATDLNGKADVDLTNVNDTGKTVLSRATLPSATARNELTLGSSGTEYTAPANGWVMFSKTSTNAGQYIRLYSLTNGNYIALNTYLYSTTSSQTLAICMPVYKGQKFVATYTAGGTTAYFRFSYTQGSESEAN